MEDREAATRIEVPQDGERATSSPREEFKLAGAPERDSEDVQIQDPPPMESGTGKEGCGSDGEPEPDPEAGEGPLESSLNLKGEPRTSDYYQIKNQVPKRFDHPGTV